MNYAVIMAGGSGKRLWPLSRQKRPKQVLRLFDGQTLLRKCFDRLTGLFDVQNIIVVTNANYVDTVRDDLKELPADNVIAEPAIRDTASAIGLAATILHKKDPDAKMAVVTADQILEPADSFRQAMTKALSFVDENPQALLTFGIAPTCPSTQLGYLKFGKPKPCAAAGNEVCSIEAFKEKPDEKTAGQYLKEGCYFWNSGLFVWRCETILNLLKKFVPAGTEPLEKIRAAWGGAGQFQALQEWFPQLPKISIDYAVMEKADHVYGIRLPCRWLDLGSFAALRDIITSDNSSNVVVSEHYQLLDSKNNIVITEEKGHLLALIGVENMIIAHTQDATLVCPIDQAGRLKELLEKIENRNQERFL
jgi:mannose-1-phosphate guanylyltransferase